MNLKDKVVLVTGSSNGIGEKSAIRFAEKGSKVVVTYFGSEEDGKKVFEKCNELSEAILLRLDVSDEKSIKRALKDILKKFGGIDILVNNAGILSRKFFLEQSLDEIKNQVEVNLLGVMNLTWLFLPHLAKSEEAIIVNVASVYSYEVDDEVAPYCATKFGVRGFTKSLAEELPENVRIYCVNPGLTATKMTDFKGVPAGNVAEVIVGVCEKNDKDSGSDVGIPS